jgi:hypothetical protein
MALLDNVFKQRMVGALVLIAVAVIFLPMLFTRQDETRQVHVEAPSAPQAPVVAQTQVEPVPVPEQQMLPEEPVVEERPRRLPHRHRLAHRHRRLRVRPPRRSRLPSPRRQLLRRQRRLPPDPLPHRAWTPTACR